MQRQRWGLKSLVEILAGATADALGLAGTLALVTDPKMIFTCKHAQAALMTPSA